MLKSPVGTAPLKEYYSHFFRGGDFVFRYFELEVLTMSNKMTVLWSRWTVGR